MTLQDVVALITESINKPIGPQPIIKTTSESTKLILFKPWRQQASGSINAAAFKETFSGTL